MEKETQNKILSFLEAYVLNDGYFYICRMMDFYFIGDEKKEAEKFINDEVKFFFPNLKHSNFEGYFGRCFDEESKIRRQSFILLILDKYKWKHT